MRRPLVNRQSSIVNRKTLRVAGLMSGTSADGIDVAIVDIGGGRIEGRWAKGEGRNGKDRNGENAPDEVSPFGLRPSIRLLAFDMFPYTRAMREAIFRLFDPRTSAVDGISAMNFAVGECFADALIRLARRHRIPLETIDLVGSHGQTIWHEPAGRVIGGKQVCSTLQIGEPSVIAERTGITTVADFRPRDIAAGGQGAPLVPLTDMILFGHPTRARALQNIGGIANVTFLPQSPRKAFRGRFSRGLLNQPSDSAVAKVLAFDTGPGNMIIDRTVQLVTGGRKAFDSGGDLARRGTIHRATLAELMRHPYLRRRPPKTTGREMFGRQFCDKLFAGLRKTELPAADIVATVTAFTARSIADAYRRFLPGRVDEVIVCGGGARNLTLMSMLREALAPAKVLPMDDLGINADAKEAVSFAILAALTYLGLPGNVPAATGAKHRAVLGKIVPGVGKTRRR